MNHATFAASTGVLALVVAAAACSSAPLAPSTASDGGADATHDARHDATHDGAHDSAADAKDASVRPDGGDSAGPTTVVFDLAADTTKPASFYSFPFPSDLRLNAAGGPDYSGFPLLKGSTLLQGMIPVASGRKGFSTLAVAYFQFTAPMGTLDPTAILPGDKTSTILLVDVDPTSPDRGTFFPTVAWTPPEDPYTAANVVTVAARPGFVLFPKRTYAFVIRREQNDGSGKELGVDPTLATLEAAKTPTGSQGSAAAALYAPLFETLSTAGVASSDVAAATVFTTGDVVADTAAMSTGLVAKYPVTITNLTVTHASPDAGGSPDAGSTYPRICELQGTVTMPQFQVGTAPFATSGGTFQIGADGLPVKQGDVAIPMAISLPTLAAGGAMPAAGFPLVLYFHGSGGVSTEFVDRGPVLVPDGGETPGQGPAYVLAPFGFAMAGAALPENPERVPDAGETEYLQVTNLASLLGNFRQGVIEQRMLLAALAEVTIDPAIVAAGCPGVSVGSGTSFHFDPASFFSQGQSMGGMYTNLITAVEPSFRAAVPTGAGGFWTYFIFQSAFVPDANGLLELALGVNHEQLTFMHPAFSMIETGWEAVDPIVSVPRLSRNPLPGTKPRAIYEPVGQNDSYFSNDVYNAIALAYGHREVGSIIWPEMQTALTEEGLNGIVPYPTSNDVHAINDGGTYTGVVVQYDADSITGNGHYVYAQLDAVKYQYGCFLSSALKSGVAVVPAPAALGTPCPGVDGGM
jgi:hypothetical protein